MFIHVHVSVLRLFFLKLNISKPKWNVLSILLNWCKHDLACWGVGHISKTSVKSNGQRTSNVHSVAIHGHFQTKHFYFGQISLYI